MTRRPIKLRPTRLRPAGPFLRLFQRIHAPLGIKLAAGPLIITVLMLLIGGSLIYAFLSIQAVGTRLLEDSQLIEHATRLQITVRGMVNYSREIVQTPDNQNIAGYFQQRKLVLETLDAIRTISSELSPDEATYLQAVDRTLAEADRMVGLVQEDKLDSARSLWDQRVHDLADTSVSAADQFRQVRDTTAGQRIVQAIESIWGSAILSVLLILAALAVVLAFGWLNTGLVARPIRLVATAMQRVAAGELDVQVELSQRDELGLLEQSFNQMTGALRILLQSTRPTLDTPDVQGEDLFSAAIGEGEESALLRTARDTAVETSRRGAELAQAYHVQAALLPPQNLTLHGWHIEASTVPAVELGGDFYDLVNLPGGRLGLVIGDVSGHGAASALLAAWTQGLISATAATERDPGRVLALVNNALQRRLPRRMMVTLGYMVLDPQQGVLEYANAGHPYPLLSFEGGPPPRNLLPEGIELRSALYPYDVGEAPAPAGSAAANGDGAADWLWLDVPGMPLGMVREAIYTTVRLPLAAIRAFCLYSDGVVEARQPSGEMFGFQRLRQACRLLPTASHEPAGASAVHHLVAAAAEFSTGHLVEDDMTVLLVRRLPGGMAPGPMGADALDLRYAGAPGEEVRVPAEPR